MEENILYKRCQDRETGTEGPKEMGQGKYKKMKKCPTEINNGPWPQFVRDLKTQANKDSNKIGWIQGVAWACGFLCTDHREDSRAADMWKESGISRQEAQYAYEYDLKKFRSGIKGGLPKGIE